MRKRLLAVAMGLFAAILLSGCARVDATATVQPDGSGSVAYTLAIHPQVLAAAKADGVDLLGDYAKEMQGRGYQAEVVATPQGQAVEVRQTGSSVSSLLETLGFAHHPGQPTLAVKKGLFRSTYTLNTMVNPKALAAPALAKAPPELQAEVDKALAQGRYTFTLHMPAPVVSHNAQDVTGDGQDLHWDLQYTQDNVLNAVAETPISGAVIALIVVAGFMLLALVILVLRLVRTGQAYNDDYYN